jgi:hypothetical protein
VTGFWRKLGILGLFLGLLLALTACAGSIERLWLDAPGWSRAQRVGNTGSADPVTVALDDTGTVYFFLIHQENDVAHPRLMALNRQVETVWDHTFVEIALTRPGQPQVFWDRQGLSLFWMSDQSLYHARVDMDGHLVAGPVLLSGDVQVASFDAVFDTKGQVSVWYAGARRAPGLYALPTGDLEGQAILVDAEGVQPDLQYDEAGALHATWAHYPPGYGDNRLFYGVYPEGIYQPGQGTVVAAPRLGTSTALQGPRLGMDGAQVYLLWTELTRTGLEAGAVRAFYLAFPQGRPDLASEVRQWFVPSTYDLDYKAFPDRALQASERAPLGAFGTSNITELTPNPKVAQELVVTFRVRVEYLRRKEQGQVSAAFFQGGEAQAYQLLSFTSVDSTSPAIVSDAAGQLYLTWLERGAGPGFKVYFASTAPDIRKGLNALTQRDVLHLSADAVFGMMSGVLLIPFVLVWLIAPVILIGLTSLVRGESERLISPGSLISLGLALLAFWAGKFISLPQMQDYVPFSAWLPIIPSWMDLLLQVGVPLFFAGLGLLLAWQFTYRRQHASLFFFVVIYALVDGLLTMAVYGVLVYGAF